MVEESKQPETPQNAGGAGGDAEEYPLIGKTKASRIERMAIHQRFPISEQEARAVIARQIKDAIDKGNTPREANSAARAVFQAMAINQSDEHKAQPDNLNINVTSDESKRREYLEAVAEKLMRRRQAAVDGNGSQN